MSKHPVAFMSYVQLDDQHEGGRLAQLRERLSGDVRIQSGGAFDILQDRNDIAWGQQWKQRIEDSLDAVTFLIPVVTPAFFKSPACRDELERFLGREADLGRADLILPVYYVEAATLSDPAGRAQDPLVDAIAARQYADFRELRFEPFTSPLVAEALAAMTRRIVQALARSEPRPSQTAASANGSTRKSGPPTLVVDALHRGDHPTLTRAIEAASPGTRILVRPGLYREGLLIEKPLEIVGDGDAGDIVIEAMGAHTILFRADVGRLSNLTLRQAGGGNWYCVDIAQGRLEVEDCDISSQSLACVGIHGGADPQLRRNRIHNGKKGGVFVYENGQGTLEDNEIFANAFAGVAIKTRGNTTLRRNRIHDGKEYGVHVYDAGQGTLEDNDIFANAFSGVLVGEGGSLTLRRNRISRNRRHAIRVREGGGGTFESNDLRGNTRGAWDLAPGTERVVKRANNLES